MGHHYRRMPLVLGLCGAFIALSLTVVGCGSGDGSSTGSPEGSGSPASSGPAALLPASVSQSGILKLGTSAPSPPMDYFKADGTTLTGLDVDLAEGVAKVLGLKPEWLVMNWDGLRPALQSKRFDMVVASMGDFTDRQEQVTFVDYLLAGQGVLVLKKDASQVTKAEGLAGKAVGGCIGTAAVTVAAKLNEKLKAEGLPEMAFKQFPTDASGILAVRSGRLFAHIMDLPGVAYQAKTASGGTLYAAVLPRLMDVAAPYGMAVRKDAEGEALAKAVAAALNQMMADGTYGQLLEKYGLSGAAIQKATINGGTTSSAG